jgi:hypothetical protein
MSFSSLLGRAAELKMLCIIKFRQYGVNYAWQTAILSVANDLIGIVSLDNLLCGALQPGYRCLFGTMH